MGMGRFSSDFRLYDVHRLVYLLPASENEGGDILPSNRNSLHSLNFDTVVCLKVCLLRWKVLDTLNEPDENQSEQDNPITRP